MPEKTLRYIPTIGISTAVCLASFISILYLSDPFQDGIVAHIFFHLSLFLTITGLATIFGLLLRQRFGSGLYIQNLSVSFRQGLFLGVLMIGSLLLQSYGILFWWVELALILFLIFFELFLNL